MAVAVTRSQAERETARALLDSGLNDCEIGKRLGIPRTTVRMWRTAGTPFLLAKTSDCPRCDEATLDKARYAYLLGLYLGDGNISLHRRGVERLRIVLDQRYPNIIDECYGAMRAMRRGGDRKVCFAHLPGCIEVSSYWKHWSCLFPQHGPGPKNSRRIKLTDWQDRILKAHSGLLLRGLIHSDGWRGQNCALVRGKRYEYPRYQFSNTSTDILDIFTRACDTYGVSWTQSNWNSISVARLDVIVGPKT